VNRKTQAGVLSREIGYG